MVNVDEEWVLLRDFPNHSVSNYGRVVSHNTDSVLRTRLSGWGYEQVVLYSNGRHVTKTVHRLVAEAFIPGWDEGLHVNHIDGDKRNNFEENLEWVTPSENNTHAVHSGLRTPFRKSVRIVETGETFPSVKACAEHLNTYSTAISQVLKGRRPHYKRMTFEYI